MIIKNLVLGSLETNCYILEKGDKCLIIDPASDANKIIETCKTKVVEEILVTHHHFDHVGALNVLENYYKIKHNTYYSNDFSYEVIKTPGHTSDSISFYFEDERVMFTGDFIFYHTCGRCDLPTGSISDMKNSLKMMEDYPDDLVIYPGHGKSTILGSEKKLFDCYF